MCGTSTNFIYLFIFSTQREFKYFDKGEKLIRKCLQR